MTTERRKFFHTLYEDGGVKCQGVVLRRSKATVTVEFFSWLTGCANGCQTFDLAEQDKWIFYNSQSEWLAIGDKVI